MATVPCSTLLSGVAAPGCRGVEGVAELTSTAAPVHARATSAAVVAVSASREDRALLKRDLLGVTPLLLCPSRSGPLSTATVWHVIMVIPVREADDVDAFLS